MRVCRSRPWQIRPDTAAQKPYGYSLRGAYKWLARYRTGGVAALADRRSVRRTQRRTIDPQQLQQAVDLRHQRCTLRRIARALQASLRAVGRDDERPGAGSSQELGTQTAGSAIPMGTPWRHDPCQHLAVGFSAGVTASQV
ncbi:MAG: helix-turn-helix domain-containing protein [Synechococcaceae cyanobacterium ELA445]